jgi:organic radical activating enzyme
MHSSIATCDSNEVPGSTKKLRFGRLEVPIADHCNLRCRACSHHAPFLQPHYYPLTRFIKDVNALGAVSEVGELLFIGGEPLLNPDIDEYVIAARAAGIAKKYSVTTNGILLHRMTDRFFEAIDYIKVSAYAVTSPQNAKLHKLLKVRSLQFNFEYIIQEMEQFYDIETRGLSTADAQESFDRCRRRLDFPLIHSGYFYKCMRPPTTREYLENRKTCENPPDFATIDGVSLDSPQLLEDLLSYMTDQNALQSCRFCLLGFYEHNVSRYTRLKKKIGRIGLVRKLLHANSATTALCHTLDSKLLSIAIDRRVTMLKHSNMTRQECAPRDVVQIRTRAKK